MNKYIKLVIAAILIGFGIYLITDREIGWAFEKTRHGKSLYLVE